MSKIVFKLTDGTEADFDSKTPLSKIDEILAKNGLERDKAAKPMVERGDIDSAIAKTNLPIVQGFSSILGLPGMVQQGAEFGAEKIAQAFGYSPEEAQVGKMAVRVPTPSQITKAVGDAGVPMQRAESFGGRTAQNVVRNIVSAPVPGAVIPSLLSAVGEEAAAYPFRGTPMESTARTAGALLTPFAAIPFTMQSPMQKMYSQGTSRLSLDELQAASNLQKESFKNKMPTTSFEAIQQVSGGRTNLPALQRQLESMPSSAPQMADFMGTRGQQTLKTLETAFPPTSRERMGTEVQRAAESTIRQSQKQLSSSPAGQAFESVKSKAIPPSWMTKLEKDSAVISEASRAVDNLPAYQDLLKGYKDNSIARIEAMRQFLTDKYDNLAGAANNQVTGEMRAYDQARRNLLNKADLQIPEYKKVREQYFQSKEQIVAPVKESPIGQIARNNEVSTQFAEVFAKNPAEVNLSPTKVKMTMKSMADADPTLPKDFLTQYMKSSLESVNNAASRGAGTTGSRFANTIAKNTTQRENLKAAYQEIYGAKGTEAVKGLNTMLDVLEAQGRRLPSGSPTFDKGALSEESLSTINKTFKNLPGAFGTMYQTIFYGRDYEKIAKAITSPNGVEALEKMAKAQKDTRKLGLAITELQRVIDAIDEEQE